MSEPVDTVADLVRVRAQDQPGRVGYTFLADGDEEELDLTYLDVHRAALGVAARLRDAGVRPGDRAILLLPPGLDYLVAFFGCLHAGVVAVPLYPPDPFQLDRSVPRLASVVADADAVAALTITPLLGFLDELTRRAPLLGELRWLSADDAPPADLDAAPVAIAPDSVAMLQYTSGSTADPKGVMVTHANLLHNSARIRELFRTGPESRGVSWLPPYHDMGLIGGLIQPLYAGASTVLLSPLHFLEKPLRWLRAVDRYRVTTSGGPNFAYDLCARKADPAEIATWDLSCWEVAFNGAEPVRPATLRRFAETFAPAGFRAEAFLRCYGLAEATLIVTGVGGAFAGPVSGPLSLDPEALSRDAAEPADGTGTGTELLSCGPSLPGQRVEIVDPASGRPLPDGRTGEIWVSGPSVAAGYWRQPDLTARTFHARLDGGGPDFLRTGDLGFRHDGELVVTGRSKDLIIIRGRNHYPQDLELTAETAVPELRPGCSAAFTAGDGELVLVHELRKQAAQPDPAAAAARIRQAVAEEHGLQVRTVVLLRGGGVPKTSSGKVRRSRCRVQFLAGELPEIARSESSAEPAPLAAPSELEDYLRGLVRAASGIGDLSRTQPLTAAGLDSLAVLQIKQRVESDLGVPLPLRPLLTGASLAELVAELAGALPETAPQEPPRPANPDCVPLPPGQRWIWLSQRFEPDSSAYNVSAALRVLDPIDTEVLQRALDAVVVRHPALRASFPVQAGEPVLAVRPDSRVAVREYDARALSGQALADRLASIARRPFSLDSGPLVRISLHRRASDAVLLLSAHHIITDFWSMTVLARDVARHYAALLRDGEPAAPAPAATYADFLAHQRELLADDARLARLARYWDDQVADGIPPLRLPRANAAAPAGARQFSLSEDLTTRLRARAAEEGATVFAVLLTAFETVLHRETGAADLAVGTSVAGRTRPEFAEVVGCCMNPVLIRSRADGTMRDLLAATREQVAGALEHQDYPMALLAARHRAPGRGGSLFEALFTFNRAPVRGEELAAAAALGPAGQWRFGPLRVENFPLAQPACALPLELMMAEADGRLHGLLRHGPGALPETGAGRLLETFLDVLAAIAADPALPVAGNILAAREG
ncbi:AMP-binding protein [Amycolatopsis nivea]